MPAQFDERTYSVVEDVEDDVDRIELESEFVVDIDVVVLSKRSHG